MKSKSFFLIRLVYYAALILFLVNSWKLHSPYFFALLTGFLCILWYDWSFLVPYFWQNAGWIFLSLLSFLCLCNDSYPSSFNPLGILIDLVPLSIAVWQRNMLKIKHENSSEGSEQGS